MICSLYANISVFYKRLAFIYCRDCRLMFSFLPKQPTGPIRFCFQSIKFPFYISFRSFRPDYLSIFNDRGAVPL